jgi:hypothetical protein
MSHELRATVYRRRPLPVEELLSLLFEQVKAARDRAEKLGPDSNVERGVA